MMTNSEPVSFGKALRELRVSSGVSLRSFAEKLGVSATYLSQLNKVTPPPQRLIEFSTWRSC